MSVEIIAGRFALMDNYTAVIFFSNFHLNCCDSLAAVQPKEDEAEKKTQLVFPYVLFPSAAHTSGSFHQDCVRPSLPRSSSPHLCPLWSFKIHSLTVEGIGHIGPAPPCRTEALHITLESVQAGSASGLRRGAGWRLWDEGQRTAASCMLRSSAAFQTGGVFYDLSLSMFDGTDSTWAWIPLTLWRDFLHSKSIGLRFQPGFINDSMFMKYYPTCYGTSRAVISQTHGIWLRPDPTAEADLWAAVWL